MEPIARLLPDVVMGSGKKWLMALPIVCGEGSCRDQPPLYCLLNHSHLLQLLLTQGHIPQG